MTPANSYKGLLPYDPSDYIRDYNDFLKAVQEQCR